MLLALFLMPFIGGAGKSSMFHIWLPDAGGNQHLYLHWFMLPPWLRSRCVYLCSQYVPAVLSVCPGAVALDCISQRLPLSHAAAVACCQRYQTCACFFYHITDRFYVGSPLRFHARCSHGSRSPYGRICRREWSGIWQNVPPFFHAMFKGCLFLCAGCIIEAVGSNEKALWVIFTNICPSHISHSDLLSCHIGYIPAERILLKGWNSGSMLQLPSGNGYDHERHRMTAFYMFRLYYVIFLGTGILRNPYQRRCQENLTRLLHAWHSCWYFSPLITVLLRMDTIRTFCISQWIEFWYPAITSIGP